MPDTKKLNPDQKKAISHKSGPLLIIAGAGTGKTTVITQRVSWLISQKLAEPGEILCLTFTEKAAQQMEERIDQLLPLGYSQMWISTFHSFCDRILRDEALNIGLDPSYTLLTATDSASLFQTHLFDFNLDYYRPLGNPRKFISGLLQHLGRLQDEDISSDQYLSWAKSLTDSPDRSRYLELAHLYLQYDQLKVSSSVMDFSDLIAMTLKLFRTRPNILSIYQQRFKYILVDEFQDTNYAQNQLVNLLASSHQNLTVVADDDQAIYRWRGAAISNVLDFRRTYPKAKVAVLTHNYRSTKTILDASYALIQHNNPDRLEIKEGIDKHLTPRTKVVGDPIEFLHLKTVDDEAEAVAKQITRLSPQYSYQDFAILVRANAHSEPFIRALARHDIPHQFLGPSKLFLQPEIKDLIAYLKILVNYSDNASLYRVLAMDYFALPGRDLATLSNFSSRSNLSIFETCEIITGQHPLPSQLQTPYLSSDTINTIRKLVEIIHHHLNLVPKTSAGELLYDFLLKTKLLQAILDYRPPLTPTIAQNITQLFSKLKSFDSQHPDAAVTGAVDWLELSSQLGDSPLASEIDWSGQNAVNILTIHSAKGLEFPVVFLVNLVSQRFPSTSRTEPIPIPDPLIKETLPEGDYHLQEERRLFYVGMTRAKEKLFITAADFYGDGKRPKKISPFVTESLGQTIAAGVTQIQDQLSLLDWQPAHLTKPLTTNHELITPITYLSYSQIETFKVCPLHYKAKYILKIPTPPSAASSFGNTIHRTLKDFYLAIGRDPEPRSAAACRDLILDIYHRSWTSEGYKDKRHEHLYQLKGEKHLCDFLENDFDPHHLPVKLEEPFTVPLQPDLKIGGKIDRVDILPDGGIEIIDYKTSAEAMDQKEADTNLQLSFYALAATSVPTPPFNKDPKDIKLTLLFLEEHQKVSTTRTVAQLAEAKQQIIAFADEIAHSDFKCSGSPLCRLCDYKILCDLTN